MLGTVQPLRARRHELRPRQTSPNEPWPEPFHRASVVYTERIDWALDTRHGIAVAESFLQSRLLEKHDDQMKRQEEHHGPTPSGGKRDPRHSNRATQRQGVADEPEWPGGHELKWHELFFTAKRTDPRAQHRAADQEMASIRGIDYPSEPPNGLAHLQRRVGH